MWDSHVEDKTRWVVDHDLNRPSAISQVTDINNNEPNDTSAGPDAVEILMKRLLPSLVESAQREAPIPSDYELFAQRLLKVAQPAVPESSDAINIEHLLRKFAEETTHPVVERREPTS